MSIFLLQICFQKPEWIEPVLFETESDLHQLLSSEVQMVESFRFHLFVYAVYVFPWFTSPFQILCHTGLQL